MRQAGSDRGGHRRRDRVRWLLAIVTAVGLLAGCGSATATHSAATVAVLPASSASSTTSSTPATSLASSGCASTVASTLGTVAARVYHEAVSGGDVEQAVHRLQSSSTLAGAVNSADAPAARAALQELTLGQIVRVQVLRGGRVFAQAGGGAAIAPVRGSIPGTSATYVLSTQSDRTYLQVVHQVTGAQVLLSASPAGHAAPGPGASAPAPRRLVGTIAGPLPAGLPAAGPVAIAGQTYQTDTLTGEVYPSGMLHIVLLVPTAKLTCPGSTAQTRVETLGHVGELVYQEELHSPDVSATLRHLESSTAFQQAVAAHDALATRDAIVGFFREHIHVVRVRVSTGAGLLVDVGGPYVLAPVHGTVRSGGHVVGQFEMAIQDDAGYLKLAHLFTGAEVLMRRGASQVMGTLSPGPASVPDRGTVSYGGKSYEAYSFVGEAFPSGPLRISLLLGD